MKTNNIVKRMNGVLILLYCALFVFGKIPTLLGQMMSIPFKPTDLILALLVILNIKELFVFKKLVPLLFSSCLAFAFFPATSLVVGFAYLLRIIGIFILGRILFTQKDIITKRNGLVVLLTMLFLVAILGWFQYQFFPDLRQLSVLGWDDHYYRLTSTFLDPAFTGLLMVFGVLLSLKHLKSAPRYLLTLFFFLTLLLTYSRASYLSLAIALLFYFYKKLTVKKIFYALAVFAVVLLLLPRPGGEGVKLERLYSISYKIQNASFGVSLIKKSPLFGFGYNNVCLVSTKYSSVVDSQSNSCHGLDNSFETILVSFGVVGAIVLIREGTSFYKKNPQLSAGFPVLLAFFVHAQFTNTLFYPYCLGFVVMYVSTVILKKS
jgi:hypothetical protein